MKTQLEAIQEIADEVLEVWKDHIGTHYDGCWKRHVGCFAWHVKMIVDREED